MAVMDEFKEERKKLKGQSFKKKFSYFWTYYKWYVLGGILAIVVITGVVRDYMSKKDDALYGILVNGYLAGDEDAFAQSFADYAGIDTEKYAVSFNATLRMYDRIDESTMSASQFITVYSAAQDLDIAIMDPVRFQRYSYGALFLDLRSVLSSEMLARLEDKLYYVDLTVVNEIEYLEDNNQSTEDVFLPDPHKPEEMDNPIPVGIDISGCKSFTDTYYYEDSTCYASIIVNSKRKDTAVKFLEFLFAE